jgi:ketosteroid isomerase-like protein
MSAKNVEIVRQVFELFREGADRDDYGAWFESEHVAEDLEWTTPGVGLGTYRGRAEFVEFMATWTEDFEAWSFELERLIDAGDDRVVGLFLQTATGKASGAPVKLHQGFVYELEGGQIVRTRNYFEPAKALEAAGLSE